MESVDVVIEATDTFSAAGLARRLESRHEVRVVPREELTGRGVFLVAVDRVSARELAYLRSFGTNPLVPKVLVTDALIETDPCAVVDCGVVSLLSRAEATEDRLVATVLDADKGITAKAVLDTPANECAQSDRSDDQQNRVLHEVETSVIPLTSREDLVESDRGDVKTRAAQW